MNLNDPKLTAYALGELSAEEASAMREALAESPEARDHVREMQELAGNLRGEFRAELQASAIKPPDILPLPAPLSFWSDARWMSIGLAALLAVSAVIAAVVLSGPNGRWAARSELPRTNTSGTDVQMMVEDDPTTGPAKRSRGRFAEAISESVGEQSDENRFVMAATNPRSTFALNVGTALYGKVKEAIEQGKLPAKDAVRIEEMLNYFAYDDPPPEENGPAFSINLEVAGCPWQSGHRLVRVGVRGGNAVVSDVRVQVDFDPASVASYRLLGFERRSSPNEQSGREQSDINGAEAPAATALYEIILVASAEPVTKPNLLTASLHYSRANGATDQVIARALTDDGTKFEAASVDLKFAAAVAEFGMILRESNHRGDGTFADVLDWANAGRGRDAQGAREEFIRLVRAAQQIVL